MQALRRVRRRAASIQQAIGAIENALVDIKAKALGIPVYELLGGPVRDRIRLYWSHCGTYRVGPRAERCSVAAAAHRWTISSRSGKEVVAERLHRPQDQRLSCSTATPRGHVPGFARGEGFPELNAERKVVDAITDQLAAFRQGAGPDMDILVDLNYNYKTEGYLKMARAMEPFDLFWVEIDTRDPEALRYIREGTTIPVASCETLYGRREFRPFFEHGSMDTAIIDVPYNGIAGVAEDRRDGGCLRGQRGAAQLLRPAGDDDERALRGDGAEPPDHGDRQRLRALVRRSGDRGARRSSDGLPEAAERARLGHRGQRGGGPGPPAADRLRRGAGLRAWRARGDPRARPGW